jgi:AcrR family transcriptional regulator
MPPKARYTREDVIVAAFAVVEENGLKALTARNVASKLSSSTAPVYQHFSTMDELALEVMKEIQKLLYKYTKRPYTDRIFLNMGTGVAMFACRHSQLYRALLLEKNNYGDVIEEFLETLEIELRNDPRFGSLSDSERHTLLDKMWTFTHGLASLICVGLIKNCSQEFIIQTLLDVGGDVISATLAKHEKQKKENNSRGNV